MACFSQDDKTQELKEAAYETPQPRTRRSGVEKVSTMRKAEESRRAEQVPGGVEGQQQGGWRA